MFAVFAKARKSLARLPFGRFAAACGALALSACVPGTTPSGNATKLGAGETVQVALLVPSGSGQSHDELLARGLQNAARLAISDLGGSRVDLRVYPTAGNAAQAQSQATKAVAEGAKIILGPVYAHEANSVGVALAGQGINVLSFSNNTEIAGGNVFVLGQTFQNTATRLSRYAVKQGKGRIMVVYDQNVAGEMASRAIQGSVAASGGQLAGMQGYELSQNGIVAAAPSIAAAARNSNAQAVFLTATTDAALPLITQMLRDNGLSPPSTAMIGLTRWDIPSTTLTLPGVQGGWFAMPDPSLFQQFQSRYQAAYGEAPPPLAGLAYDGIAAIGALMKRGNAPLSTASLTQGSGFVGVNGIFRLRPDGSNERGLAVATIQNNQLSILDPAPRSFGGAGF